MRYECACFLATGKSGAVEAGNLSAFFPGLDWAFYAAQFGVVGSIVFSVSTLLFLLAIVLVEGLGTDWGPLLGAAVLMVANEGLREVGGRREIGLGLLFAAFVILLPSGLVRLRRRQSA